MSTTLSAIPVPLREDADGALRVGQTRVLLELVIHAFDGGQTPESIVEEYSTLLLPDVYAVIAYYLANRDAVANYLARRVHEAAEIRARIEASQRDLGDLRQRIAAMRPEPA